MTTPSLFSKKRAQSALWLLVLAQFTVSTESMIMMPLAPQITHAFGITPSTFVLTVSIYAWSAGLSSLLAATYADRFDRKLLFLVVYMLFALSNILCALSPNLSMLLLGRICAGLTGGVLSTITLAIVADIIPEARRGAAMGALMISFSLATIAGLPVGLLFSNLFGWNAPFFFLGLLSLMILFAAFFVLPALKIHLTRQALPLSQVLPDLFRIITNTRYLRGFILTAGMMISLMLIVPFISLFLVDNVGINQNQLLWIYLVGAVCTFFTSQVMGRLSDRLGQKRMLRWLALLSILPILGITHLPVLPLWAVMIFFTLLLILISGRLTPMQTLLNTVSDPQNRATFTSVNSTVNQLASGLGGWLGGLWLSQALNGQIIGYNINGWVSSALVIASVFWAGFVRSRHFSEPKTSLDTTGSAEGA